MSGRSWARSGMRGTQRGREPRPPDAFSIAVDRARRWWLELAKGPDADGNFSDVAAASIMATALALWPDVAAELDRERAGE
jgi:hypothetical protein